MSVLVSYRSAWVPVVVIVLVVAAAGCDARQIPGSPSQTPPPPPPPAPAPPRILGQVFEITAAGRVPAANISLVMTVITGNCPARICSSRVHRFDGITSGADGRYEFSSLPPDSTRAFVSALTAGYYQTCGAAAILLPSVDTRLDLEITSSSNPRSSPSPTPLLLIGQVFEMTPSGRVGIGHALVGLEYPFSDMPFFQVEADSDGRYVLCGVPASQQVAVWAWADGYDDDYYSWRTFTTSTTHDIELIRHLGQFTGGGVEESPSSYGRGPRRMRRQRPSVSHTRPSPRRR
jgi:hypothetical protein